MSYHLAPIANAQQLDANGNPLSGGKIHTYIAGTSTPATTYADESGAAAQTNPIILNSRGVPANPVWVQGGRTYKFVVTDANGVQLAVFDDVAGINDVTGSFDQWVAYANPPSYISATSFSVAGDQTPTFQVGRRLKSVNTGGTIYSTILTATYAAGITTITVANDMGSLDSGLSAVSYGLISANSSSLPVVQSLAVNGHHKLPGGLILQWGMATISGALQGLITFPLAFPTATLNASVTDIKASTGDDVVLGLGSTLSATQMGVVAKGGVITEIGTFRWFAIGH